MSEPQFRLHSRRQALHLGALGGVALLAACTRSSPSPSDMALRSEAPEASGGSEATAPPAVPSPPTLTAARGPTATPTPTPTPVPTPAPAPPPPRGREAVALMGGTEWETSLFVTHSGVEGPTLLVLGGVHGNEPGSWLAADDIADWEPARGSLLVAPRANVLAIAVLQRTTDELGDLNRLYPGAHDAELPMARMAAQIVDVARHYEVDVVLDLHESWGFYAERGENQGTAFLGQTITTGPSVDRTPLARIIADLVNAQIEVERDLLIARDWTQWPAVVTDGEIGAGIPESATASAFARTRWRPGRGRSSLSLGIIVPGVLPVLVEMGQREQPIERRI
ncbi:MAG: hypothetical protein F4X80_01795, partial [Chloroflexi bacterium]|nr:hypothetical protein [Chloroflexota bacterium]